MKKQTLNPRLLKVACALAACALIGHRAAAQTYTTDFENPPYTSGLVNAQDSWVSTLTNSRVLTATEISADLTTGGLVPGTPVHSGNQALLISGGGASQNTTRLLPGAVGYSQTTVELWTRPLFARTDAASLGNTFFTLEDSASVRAAAFRFGYDAATTNTHIDYADGAVGSAIWKSTGIPWDPTNTWYQIKFVVDYANQTYDFFLNGSKVNTNPIAFYSGNVVNSLGLIRAFRGTSQAGMILDDITVSAVAPTNPVPRLIASSPFSFRYRIFDGGTSTPDTNTLTMTLDGVPITPTSIVQYGNLGAGDGTGVTTLFYDATNRIFATGSTHTNTIHFGGSGFDDVDRTFSFTVTPLLGTLDRVHHYPGRFQGTLPANYGNFTSGHTGAAADFALDMGIAPGTNNPSLNSKLFADDPDLLAALNKCMANDIMSCSIWTKRRTMQSSSVFWLNSPNAPVSGRAYQLHGPYSDNHMYFDTGGGTLVTARMDTNVAYLGGITFWQNWHHIVTIKNGAAKQIYLDGQLLADQPSGAASISGYNDLNRVIVGAASPDGLSVNGALDDFAAYSSVLSPTDIAALYSGTAPNAIGAAADLVVWWDFSDAPGLTVTNSGNDAVVRFTQTLQSSTNITGPFSDVSGATSPYTNSGPQKFFRTRK